MVFTGKDRSNGFVKRVTSSFSMRKKKNDDDHRDLRRSTSTGSNYESTRLQAKKISSLTCKPQKKSAGVSPLSSQQKDGHDLRKQFVKGKSFDDSDSIWLSSECTSPSFFLEERRLSVSFHFSVDERVVSWLSNLASSSLSLDKGINSLKGRQTSCMDKEHLGFQNIVKNGENVQKEASDKEKGSNSSLISLGKVFTDFSTKIPEAIKSSCAQLSEDSTSSINFTAPSNTSLDPSSWASEANNIRFSPSSGTGSESERSLYNSEFVSSDTCISVSKSVEDKKSQIADKFLEQAASGTADLKNCIADEPLFWPFEQKFDWTPDDILKHFSMSPRKKQTSKAKTSAGTSPASIRAQLHTKKLEFKDGCKRRLVFNSVSKESNMPELKRTISGSDKNNDSINKNNKCNSECGGNKNGMKRINSLPSRLRKSNKMSTKVVPLEIAEEKAKTANEKQKFVRKSRTFLEDDFATMKDLSIENIVGLAEFNGREGIDSDFNGDLFLLVDSL